MERVIDVLAVMTILEPDTPIEDLAARAIAECDADFDADAVVRVFNGE